MKSLSCQIANSGRQAGFFAQVSFEPLNSLDYHVTIVLCQYGQLSDNNDLKTNAAMILHGLHVCELIYATVSSRI